MPLLSTFGAASARGFGNLSGIALPSDDLWNTVSFLSHFDGTNNGTNNSFDDSSSSNHTITANGNVTQGSFGPFARSDGYWGVAFDGTGDYIHTAQSAYSNTGSFTAEAWVFTTVTDTVNERRQHIITQQKDNDASRSNFALEIVRATQIVFRVFSAAGDKFVAVTSNSGLEPNTWTHISGSFDGSNLRVFVDGVLKGTTASTNAPRDTTQPVAVGARTTNDAGTAGTEFFQGYISNARLTKSAVYTSAFTPSTAPLTAITNTNLLTCQSNRFVDNSTSAHTITPSGDAAISAFGPFLTSSVYDAGVNGASAYFDGAGDYLNTSSSSDFNLSSGDWTIDGWINNRVITANNRVFSIEGTSNTYSLIRPNTNPIFDYNHVGSGSLIRTSDNVSYAGEWTHFALVSSSGTITLWINGVSEGTTTTYPDNSDNQITVAASAVRFVNSSTDGYISNFRVVNGTAIYTSAFTPPTAPLTAVTNTKLLLNMADGQAIDSAAQNNLTLYGNAKISNTQAKFGDTSIYFDGTGDYAVVEDFTQLTGELTIEFWVNPSALDPKNGLFQQGFANGGLSIRVETGGSLTVSKTGVSNYFSTTNTISANVWTHIALVYYNGVLKCYINGTADAQTSTTSADWTTSGNEFILGTRWYNGAINNPMTGYIDDFRISKPARYTSNFTAPTEAFPDKGQ